jgi:hypothetical protein
MAISGPIDARILLGLRCARRAFFPLLWLGLAGATVWILVVRDLGAAELEEELLGLSEDNGLFQAILSPLAGVAFAFLWRIGVALAALGVAYPLTRGIDTQHYPDASALGGRWRLVWDRWYWTRAYRALRWTWAVRAEAIDRAGTSGPWLDLCERLVRVSGYVLVVAWLVMLVAAA